MGTELKGICAKCGNELGFTVYTQTDTVTPEKMREAIKKEDFGDVNIYSIDSSFLEYRCLHCSGALLPEDRDILLEWFNKVIIFHP